MLGSHQAPWFKFYARDWLSGMKCRSLPPATRAAYIDLLCQQWIQGELPPDNEVLIWLTSQGYDTDAIAIDLLLALFPDRINPRLQEERDAMNEQSRKRSEAGEKGAKARWDKEKQGHGKRIESHSDRNTNSCQSEVEVEVDTEVEEYVLSERAEPAVDNVENLHARLGPHARKLTPKRDEQNRWIAWAKRQTVDLDTLESWMGGLALLRDKGTLEWIEPDVPVTCKIYERFPEYRAQSETAWARYGPGSNEGGRSSGGLGRVRSDSDTTQPTVGLT